MATNNWRAPQVREPSMNAGNWGSHLQLESRQRIVNKIMDTLKRHFPCSGQENLPELKKIAVRFEEKIYAAATSEADYFEKIALKMYSLETRSQNAIDNSSLLNSAGNINRPPDPGCFGIQPQVPNQGLSLSMPLSANQSQSHQQLLSQNIQNNIPPAGVQSSARLSSALPSSGLTQTPISSTVGQNPNIKNMSGTSQNSFGNSMGQGGPSHMSANSQGQMQGMQEVVLQPQQPHPSQNSQKYMYHQQLKRPLLKPKSASNLLLSQKSQPHALQQQLLSQIQSQPTQMQHLVLQQQSNPLQRDMPHRLQTSGQVSGTVLQTLNVRDQQRQLHQSQSVLPETSSNSTAQTGHATRGDWQEVIYQKIKVMKEMYLTELSEMHQKIFTKFQQHDSVPQRPNPEQLDNLKMFKTMLEHFISVLQVSKSSISPGLKDKLILYEKRIVNFINTNRPRERVSSLQQGQLPPPHMHSMQQSQTQITQVQSHENQMNPQLQSINVQGSVATMQQNNMTRLEQNPMPSLSGFSTAQQNVMNSLQLSSNMDSGQGNALNSLQQVPVRSNHQTPISAPQKMNMNALSSQSGVNMLQANMNSIQSNSGMLQHQHIKQQQEQKINDVNELKMRQAAGQHAFPHQQLKSGSPFPISSTTQLLQAASPKISQHSSPQVDQQNLLAYTKAGTSSSPFVTPSPSTPMAPSSLPGDSEKPSSLSNAGKIGHLQATGVGAQIQSLAIGTPGTSASPLLAEFSVPDGTHVNALSRISGKSNVTEQPLERLIKAVKSMSSNALSASVSDIGSVVSMSDRIAGSAPGKGSRAAVGEDLITMTKCYLQGRNVLTGDGTNGSRKMRCFTSAVPLNVVPSAGNDSFRQLTSSETSDLESTATSRIKRPRIEANHALLEEIREIRQRLINTVVDISDEDDDPSAFAADGGEGTIFKCFFDAVAFSPNLKSQYASAQMSPIQPLRLLVPSNYPNCSPILLDKFPVEVSKEYEDLSVKAKSKFSISLQSISQPMSLGEIARTWEVCARAVISEHAQQSGGGSFSTKYGTWEKCLSAA